MAIMYIKVVVFLLKTVKSFIMLPSNCLIPRLISLFIGTLSKELSGEIVILCSDPLDEAKQKNG
jgi:hypothetical protein